MRFLTAIPVHNEEKYLEGVLNEVARHADDILVVDDGSTDRTPVLLRQFPAVQVVRHPRNLGYGAGLRTAFQRALEGGYDGLVTLDCDGQHEPVLIPALASRLADADLVSGSGLAAADQHALAQANSARFESLEQTGPDKSQSALQGLTWGDLIFEWRTLPLLMTNSPQR